MKRDKLESTAVREREREIEIDVVWLSCSVEDSNGSGYSQSEVWIQRCIFGVGGLDLQGVVQSCGSSILRSFFRRRDSDN